MFVYRVDIFAIFRGACKQFHHISLIICEEIIFYVIIDIKRNYRSGLFVEQNVRWAENRVTQPMNILTMMDGIHGTKRTKNLDATPL